jgi:hypothetical protein
MYGLHNRRRSCCYAVFDRAGGYHVSQRTTPNCVNSRTWPNYPGQFQIPGPVCCCLPYCCPDLSSMFCIYALHLPMVGCCCMVACMRT